MEPPFFILRHCDRSNYFVIARRNDEAICQLTTPLKKIASDLNDSSTNLNSV